MEPVLKDCPIGYKYVVCSKQVVSGDRFCYINMYILHVSWSFWQEWSPTPLLTIWCVYLWLQELARKHEESEEDAARLKREKQMTEEELEKARKVSLSTRCNSYYQLCCMVMLIHVLQKKSHALSMKCLQMKVIKLPVSSKQWLLVSLVLFWIRCRKYGIMGTIYVQ